MSVSRRRLSLTALALACALIVGSTPDATAQCFGPDNLNLGACCAPITPSLPVFPQVSVPGLGICWMQCSVNTTRTLKVSWTPPTQVFCGEYVAQLSVADGISGNPLMSGKLVLDYTRTWIEIDNTGALTQVWRFVAKADMSSVAGPGAPCPVPNCLAPAGPHPTAFFYGYCDYSTCTAAGGIENALVLYHASDRFIHAPGFSDKPGAFHPTGSYAIVAPHSAVQPFTPANLIATGGPLVGEATRSVNNLGPLVCTAEDPVAAGAMIPLGAGCVNTLSTLPKQQTLRQFQGQTTCVATSGVAGGWTSLNVSFPGLPWFHLVTTSIGFWGNPNVYPGQEQAWVDEGLFIHQDACTGDFIELKYGGTTRNGWTVIPMSPPPITQFTDLADNYTAPLFGPYPFPINGSIAPTDHLIYVNEP